MLVVICILGGTLMGFGSIYTVHADSTLNFTDITGLEMLDAAYSSDLGMFVAVGNTASNGKIFVSKDGSSWVLTKSDAPKFKKNLSSEDGSKPLYRQRNVVWAKSVGKFIILTSAGNTLVTSEDGWKWAVENVTGGYAFDYIFADDYRVLAEKFAVQYTGQGNTTQIMKTTDLSSWQMINGATEITGGRRFAISNNEPTNPAYLYFRRYTATASHLWTKRESDSNFAVTGVGGGTNPGFGDVIYSAARGAYLMAYDDGGATDKGVANVSLTGVITHTPYYTASGNTGTTAIATSGSRIVIGSKNGKLFTASDVAGALSFAEVQADTGVTPIPSTTAVSSVVSSPENISVAAAGANLIVISDGGTGYKYTVVTQFVSPTIEVAGIQYLDETNAVVTTLSGQTSVKVGTTVKSNVASQKVTFIAVLYDVDGNMKCVSMDSNPVTNTTPLGFEVTLSDSGTDLAGYKIKTFVWDDVDVIAPLANTSVFQK